jgi:hypothetical protein
MLKSRRRLPTAVFAAVALGAGAAPAQAQEAGNTLGPPQLRNFQLPGERRTPPAREQQVQPAPQQPPQRTPAPATQPAPRQAQPAPETRPRPAETQRAPAAARPAPQAVPSQPEEVFRLPEAPPVAAPQSAPAPAPTGAPPAPRESTAWWLYLIPVAGLLALGALLVRRRRRHDARAEAMAAAAALDAPPVPRPDPVPRPWLELELKAERAASTDAETTVDFEMIIRNTGKSPARNIRVNARMFNAGREQDKEIGAFFKSKGAGRKTHTIGELPAGERGLIQGTVTMPREEMRALQVNEQLLFIPVVGVNLVYDWGNGRSGQTSKSYVIGRELGAESEKMGAFRLDLGPRVYRTVGQRQHSLAKRV